MQSQFHTSGYATAISLLNRATKPGDTSGLLFCCFVSLRAYKPVYGRRTTAYICSCFLQLLW